MLHVQSYSRVYRLAIDREEQSKGQNEKKRGRISVAVLCCVVSCNVVSSFSLLSVPGFLLMAVPIILR